MSIFPKRYSVKPNTVGYLYRNNKFSKILEAGNYTIIDFFDVTEVFIIPLASRLKTIINQEVLSKDNIAFRFSFFFEYKIQKPDVFLSQFSLDKPIAYILLGLEEKLAAIAQVYLRDKLSLIDSEEISHKRTELIEKTPEELIASFGEMGIELLSIQIKDITFPKSIQDLFSKQLEAKIRSKTELENARTAVSTARALKNVSELIKNDDNIKFVQLLDTINKISEKGKHTFMFGDLQQYIKSSKSEG